VWWCEEVVGGCGVVCGGAADVYGVGDDVGRCVLWCGVVWEDVGDVVVECGVMRRCAVGVGRSEVVWVV